MIESGVSNHWRGDTQPETCVVPSVPAVPLGRLQAVSVQAGRRLAEPEVGNFTEKDIYFLQKQPRSCNGCTAQRGTWSRHLCRCPRLWPSRHLFQPSSQLELPGLQLAKGQGVIPKEYAEPMPAGWGGADSTANRCCQDSARRTPHTAELLQPHLSPAARTVLCVVKGSQLRSDSNEH